MTGAGAGIVKTLDKLERNVQAGNYYEAQQMYRTVYARYVALKKYSEALDLLQSGASVQFKNGQVTCGVELGLLFIETLGKAGLKCDSSSLDRIKCIANSFPRENFRAQGQACLPKSSEAYVAAKTRVDGFCTYIKAAISWCIDSGGPIRGSPELHYLIAEYIWSESPDLEISKASFHFVRSSQLKKFAAALTSFSKFEPEAADLMVARGVLLYLSLGNLRDANLLLNEVEKMIDKSLLTTPLTQFVKYLLRTLERDALPLFRMLREKYRSYIERDSSLTEYLDTIAEKFYGVHKTGFQGMFGELMKQMFLADNRI